MAISIPRRTVFLISGAEPRYHRPVSVFKRQPGTHMHIRTPITIGVVVLLVVFLSAFCYYHVGGVR
jgi:hypothetical protein